ncbi:hypothetical protein LWI28_018201 [Acer negundo]|uniref:Myb/SANT-like domain-containing protein n=1 Tax=Acer negundo TaxID=4023 RepID=A0AAD5IVZ1_ACENE|nr:hypothetical protein LWI28_018201 [Acer negundo]
MNWLLNQSSSIRFHLIWSWQNTFSENVKSALLCIIRFEVNEIRVWTLKPITLILIFSWIQRRRCPPKILMLMKKHSGFSWDPVNNIVTASNELWADYAKRVPGVKPYRKQGLKYYDVLGEIFDVAKEAGQLTVSPSQLPPNKDDGHEPEAVIPKDPPVECNKGKRIRQPVIQSLERPIKRWNKMENLLEICSDVMSQKLEKAKEKSHESINKGTETYSIEECIETVEAMGDVDNSTFIKLMDKIVFLEWRKVFLAMNDMRRRAWLSSL